jgi:hypothetical protein
MLMFLIILMPMIGMSQKAEANESDNAIQESINATQEHQASNEQVHDMHIRKLDHIQRRFSYE